MAITNYANNAAAANALVNAVAVRGLTPSAQLSAEEMESSVLANMLSGQVGGAVLATGPGAGITAGDGTIVKSGVAKEGDIFVTKILVDLTGLASTTTDLDIIGTTGVCHIGQITTAANGTILAGTIECYEVPATGADDIDFYSASVATGAYDAEANSLTSAAAMVTRGGAWALGDVRGIAADSVQPNDYLYIANGESGTVGTYSAGRFLITLYGV